LNHPAARHLSEDVAVSIVLLAKCLSIKLLKIIPFARMAVETLAFSSIK
jgi:hypothetical protein